MRIPVGSCEGCNQKVQLLTQGYHCLGDGKYMRCKFVEAEMADVKDCQLLGVFGNQKAALRATDGYGPILWSGQGPREFWLALRWQREAI